MGQTHSNINNGEAERAMVEQDAMVLNEEPVMKKQVSSSLAETSVEEESDDDYDAEFEEVLSARAERRRILEEAEELKRLARMYLHPEDPVVSSPSACARCYFNRASAVEQESYEEAEERASVLADAANLKRLAVHYMHPEIGVQTTDSTACARNYFDRASAVEQESYEEAEERASVLADAANLKRLAVHYMHPEIGVQTTDSTACARCYFDRASAVEQESYEEAEERASVLADAANLKRLAVHYMHPEIGVQTTDPTVFGRNYYSRFSADDVDSIEESDERARALADCTALIRRLEDTSSGIETLKVVSSVSPKVFSAPILKTVDTSVTKSVSRSASHVKLFGLDEENGDATF